MRSLAQPTAELLKLHSPQFHLDQESLSKCLCFFTYSKRHDSKRIHLKSKSYEHSSQEVKLSMFSTVIPPATSFSGCKLVIQEHLQYKENLILPAPCFSIRNGGMKGIGPTAALQSLHARVSISKLWIGYKS